MRCASRPVVNRRDQAQIARMSGYVVAARAAGLEPLSFDSVVRIAVTQ